MKPTARDGDARAGLPVGLSVTVLLSSLVWAALAIALAINALRAPVLERFAKTILIAGTVMTAAGMAGAAMAVDQLLRGCTRAARIVAAWLWVNAAFLAVGGLWKRNPHPLWPAVEIVAANALLCVALVVWQWWRRRTRSGVATVAAAALAAALAMPALCRADTLSLPLQGYFHPGRAMPVAWEMARPASVEVWADGAVRTHVESANPRGILPLLTVDRDLGEVHWRIDGAAPQRADWTLHPLEDYQHLVASETHDAKLERQLFSGGSVVPVVLEGDAVTGPAMAWDGLDGLVLSPGSFARLSPDFCRGLLAEGVTLAVTGTDKPPGPWPWRKGSGLWMASSQLPLPSMFNGDVYAPAWGWSAGRSGAFRLRIILLGLLFCLAVCGVGLWRSVWMPAAVVLLCVAAMGIGYWDNSRQSPVISVSGTVRLRGLPMPIADVWYYQDTHRDSPFSVAVSGMVQPFASDQRQLRIGQLVLKCDASGEPTDVTGFLPADSPLCLLSRGIDSPTDDGDVTEKVTSPLRLLGRGTVYPEFRVSGELVGSGAQSRWATVVMRVRE